MPAFVSKKSPSFFKNSNFTQSNNVRAVLKIFKFSFHFLYNKIYENVTFTTMGPESGIQIAPSCSKIKK